MADVSPVPKAKVCICLHSAEWAISWFTLNNFFHSMCPRLLLPELEANLVSADFFQEKKEREGISDNWCLPKCKGVFPNPSRWFGSAPWSKSNCTKIQRKNLSSSLWKPYRNIPNISPGSYSLQNSFFYSNSWRRIATGLSCISSISISFHKYFNGTGLYNKMILLCPLKKSSLHMKHYWMDLWAPSS